MSLFPGKHLQTFVFLIGVVMAFQASAKTISHLDAALRREKTFATKQSILQELLTASAARSTCNSLTNCVELKNLSTVFNNALLTTNSLDAQSRAIFNRAPSVGHFLKAIETLLAAAKDGSGPPNFPLLNCPITDGSPTPWHSAHCALTTEESIIRGQLEDVAQERDLACLLIERDFTEVTSGSLSARYTTQELVDLNQLVTIIKDNNTCSLQIKATAISHSFPQLNPNIVATSRLQSVAAAVYVVIKNASYQDSITNIDTHTSRLATDLSNAGMSGVEFGLNNGLELQLFRQSSYAWEVIDVGSKVTLALGILSAVIASSAKSDDSKKSFGILAGSLGLVGGGGLVIGKLQEGPVQDVADRVGVNRIVGLSIQRMQAEVEAAKASPPAQEPPPVPNYDSISSQAKQLTGKLNQATIAARALLERIHRSCGGTDFTETNGALTDVKSLADTIKVLCKTDGTTVVAGSEIAAIISQTDQWLQLIRTIQKDRQDIQVLVTGVETVADARVTLYKRVATATQAALRELRGLLGEAAASQCEGIPESKVDRKGFCELPVQSGSSSHAAASLLSREAVKNLVELGEKNFGAYRTINTSLVNSSHSLLEIRKSINNLAISFDSEVSEGIRELQRQL
ncbi:hypothetical protein F0U62_01125 [Cystobacter fuscus]|uniref:hypothetical protein n=1 Tax=Cystobacter fuscus TaxID=43 RepID=UPI002B2F9152|nr:hypothetical protein F0U62_01125 [Cystobacter fuscus]